MLRQNLIKTLQHFELRMSGSWGRTDPRRLWCYQQVTEREEVDWTHSTTPSQAGWRSAHNTMINSPILIAKPESKISFLKNYEITTKNSKLGKFQVKWKPRMSNLRTNWNQVDIFGGGDEGASSWGIWGHAPQLRKFQDLKPLKPLFQNLC